MVIRKTKDKCKDAARMRREKERTEFVELSKLLPLPSTITSQLDKASIIRLTSSYLRMRAAFPKGLGENWGTPRAAWSLSAASVASSSPPNYNTRVASPTQSGVHHFDSSQAARTTTGSSRQQHHMMDNKQPDLRNQITHTQGPNQTHIRELGSLILQTLDGFVFALHRDGKIMYISETASVLLGLPQIDLTGSSIFEYVHPADHNDLVDLLALNEHDRLEIDEQLAKDGSEPANLPRHLEIGRSFCMRMKCILPKRNAGLVHNGYKVIHCTGYLKVRRNIGGSALGGGNGAPGVRRDLDWESFALVAVGHSLLPCASVEIKLNATSFMFRAHLDLRLTHIEAPASSLLGHQQAELVGRSLYQFVHVADSQVLEQAHRSLLSKGQVVSKYFRLMRHTNDTAGFVWMQMCACLISNPRTMPRSQHMVGVCWLIGEDQLDESRSIVLPALSDCERAGQSGMRTAASTASIPHLPGRNLLMVAAHVKADCSALSAASAKKQQARGKLLPSGQMKRTRKSRDKLSGTKVARASREQRKISERVDAQVKREQQQQQPLSEQAYQFSKTIGTLRRPSDDSSSVFSSVASTSASSRPPTASTTMAASVGLLVSSQIPSSATCPCSVSACGSSMCSSSSSTSSATSWVGKEYYSPNRYEPCQLGSNYNAPTAAKGDSLAYADSENMTSLSASKQPIYLLHPTYGYATEPCTTTYAQDMDNWTAATATTCHQQSFDASNHPIPPSNNMAGVQYYFDHGVANYYDHQADYSSGNYQDDLGTYDTHQVDIVPTPIATCFVGHQAVL